MKRVVGLLISAALAGCVTAGSVRADDALRGYYGHGFPWFGYGHNGPAAYALGNIPAPPYFALHPPVYYSHPTARPYGHSPFACSCACHHGEPRTPPPRVVANPYNRAKSEGQKSTRGQDVAAVPVRVSNPYVVANPRVDASLASHE
jgi:hypothetical protein